MFLLFFLILCAVIGPLIYRLLSRGAPDQHTKNFVLTVPATVIVSGCAWLFVIALLGR